jgi:predicted enzyme related to lactoylglutathione lyase
MFEARAAFSGLSVNDIARAKEFYTEVLGFMLESEEMGLRLALPGGGTLFIYQKDDHTPATFTVLNIVVSDIDAAVEELAGRGVSFERYDDLPAPQDEKQILRGRSAPGQGPDIAWFKDPAGNILSVLQN